MLVLINNGLEILHVRNDALQFYRRLLRLLLIVHLPIVFCIRCLPLQFLCFYLLFLRVGLVIQLHFAGGRVDRGQVEGPHEDAGDVEPAGVAAGAG